MFWTTHTLNSTRRRFLYDYQVLRFALKVKRQDLTLTSDPDEFSLRGKYYFQIRWIAIKNNPANALIRIFCCGLFIGLVAYVQYKIGQVANGYVQILICWVLTTVIGSYQFDNEKFYRHYPHYLNSLLNQFRTRYCLDILPAMFIALLSSVAMYYCLHFSLSIITLLPLGVLITMICVSKFNRNLFIIPSLLYALFMYIL